ncbi:MAG: hypothetical protein ABIY37_03975 [Devosia sp.]
MKLSAINVIGTVALAAAVIFTAPALADDPGANPAGSWVCLATGATEPTGVLTMSETTYAFTEVGTQHSTRGTYRIDRSIITLASGPLEDDFGLGRGYFNTRTSPLALTFEANGGMICNPDIYL